MRVPLLPAMTKERSLLKVEDSSRLDEERNKEDAGGKSQLGVAPSTRSANNAEPRECLLELDKRQRAEDIRRQRFESAWRERLMSNHT